MHRVSICRRADVSDLAHVIAKVAMGKPMTVVVEEGVAREYHGAECLEMPNGTVTITVTVNGGAHDTGDPKREPVEQADTPVYLEDLLRMGTR